jgi:hypothetical protein
MFLPTSLCFFPLQGASGSEIGKAAFVHASGRKDVITSEFRQGRRVGGQTGYYGAYIDAAQLPPDGEYYWYNDRGVRNSYNMPIFLGASGYSWITAQGRIHHWWQDAGVQHVAVAEIWFWIQFRWQTVDGERVLQTWLDGNRFKIVTGRTVYTATQEAIEAAYESRTPSGSYSLQGVTSTTDYWNEEFVPVSGLSHAFLSQDYAAIGKYYWDNAIVEPAKTAIAVWAHSHVSGSMGGLGQTPWQEVSRDYSKVIPLLLHTYEFSDPMLADGTIGRSSHMESRATPASEDPKDVWIVRGGPYGTPLFEWLVQHAWFDALQAIPRANQNSLQNLQAAFELLANIRSGNLVEIPDILMSQWEDWTRNADHAAKAYGELWLKYRYEYTTTKADIDEYVAFGLNIVDRYMQQISSSRVHGHAEKDGCICNCSMTWAERGLTGLQSFFKGLYTSGLEPNAYVLWDFVPFSFVADWIAPIGDVLQVYSDSQYKNELYYEFSDVVFSIRYSTGPIAGMTAEHYVRWIATEPTPVEYDYWFDREGGASPTTVFKRVLDTGSLIVGAAH